MWLAKQLNYSGELSPVRGLFEPDKNGMTLAAGQRVPLSGTIAPYGYFALPAIDDEAAACVIEDRYFLTGALSPSVSVEPGEILIKSAAGGYIHFCDDGGVVINGLKITAAGQIEASDAQGGE